MYLYSVCSHYQWCLEIFVVVPLFWLSVFLVCLLNEGLQFWADCSCHKFYKNLYKYYNIEEEKLEG